MSEDFKKHFEKLDQILEPITKSELQYNTRHEEKKSDYYEILQNNNNQKLIDKYLKKNQKLESQGNNTASFSNTKEKVYQKILDSSEKNNEDYENYYQSRTKRAQDSKSSPKSFDMSSGPQFKSPATSSNQEKYYSTVKVKDGLHPKVSLDHIEEEDGKEKGLNLQELLKKKKAPYAEKKYYNYSLTPKSSHAALDSPTSPQKYRVATFVNEEETQEKKLKSTNVHLRKIIDQQKHELNKLYKTQQENSRYISKLEAVLNDEITKKGSKVNKQINNSNSLSNKRLSQIYVDAKRNSMKEVKDSEYIILKQFFIDARSFAEKVGEMVKEIESNTHGLKVYTKENPRVAGFTKRNTTLMDIPSFEGKTDVAKIYDNFENINRVMKNNYQEFNHRMETKYYTISSEILLEPGAKRNSNSLTKNWENNTKGSLIKRNTMQIDTEQRPHRLSAVNKKYRPSAGITMTSNLSNQLYQSQDSGPKKTFDFTTTQQEGKKSDLKITEAIIEENEKIHAEAEAEAPVEKEKPKDFSGRAPKRVNTVGPANNSKINRLDKRMNTINPVSGIETRKMSNIIKLISDKRLNTKIENEII